MQQLGPQPLQPEEADPSEALDQAPHTGPVKIPAGPETDLDAALEAAVAKARDHLLSLQNEDGHWCAELDGDSILESEYRLLLHFLGRGHQSRVGKAAEYIRRQQRPDGGWAIYPGGPPDVSASVKAYFVLKLQGDDPDAPHMAEARERILELGGVEATNSYTLNPFTFLSFGGAEPNAADLQILTTVRSLMSFADIAPALEGRPAAEAARRVVPELPGPVPAWMPDEWLAPLRDAQGVAARSRRPRHGTSVCVVCNARAAGRGPDVIRSMQRRQQAERAWNTLNLHQRIGFKTFSLARVRKSSPLPGVHNVVELRQRAP